MRALRSAGVLGALALALGLITAGGAYLVDPALATDAMSGYYAVAPAETVSTRAPSRVGEVIADRPAPGTAPLSGYAERLARHGADRVVRPLPRPRGDRGPPPVLPR